MNSKKVTIGLVVLGLGAAVAFGTLQATAGGVPAPPRADLETVVGNVASVNSVTSQIVNAEPWSLDSFTNANGRVCLRQRVPSSVDGSGTACADEATLFASGPIHSEVDTRALGSNTSAWSVVWVYGWTSPNLAKLVAVLSDCRQVAVQVTSGGVFSHVFTNGELPQELIGYRADNSVLQQRQLSVGTSPTDETPVSHPCP